MQLVKLLAVAATMVAGLAQAETKGFVRTEYYSEENVATKADNMAYAVVPGVVIDKTWELSAQFRTSQAEIGNGAITNGVEARVTRLFSVGTMKPYISLRVGQTIKSTEDFAQYNVIVGTKFPIAGSLSGDVGVRYKDAFNKDNQQTTRPHFGLNYALTKQDAVGVRYARSYGDSEVDQWRVTYTRSF
jgi:hypothetical protein